MGATSIIKENVNHRSPQFLRFFKDFELADEGKFEDGIIKVKITNA